MDQLTELIGAVRDPHLPFGLAELGMLEQVVLTAEGSLEVVVNVPCHHCPGLQVLRDDIESAVRAAGVVQTIAISFQGKKAWQPMHMSSGARAAMRVMGIQINPSISEQQGASV